MILYIPFCCPNCLWVASKPWRQAWCACEPECAVQGFDPSDEDEGSELQWTEMRPLDPVRLQQLVNES